MSKLESSNVEVQQLSDDSSNEAGSDSEVYVLSDTSEEGTFGFFSFFVIVVIPDKSSIKTFLYFIATIEFVLKTLGENVCWRNIMGYLELIYKVKILGKCS